MLITLGCAAAGAAPVHVWEKQELTFTAANSYKNAYTDVVVWVDLTGPGFQQACLWVLGWGPNVSSSRSLPRIRELGRGKADRIRRTRD